MGAGRPRTKPNTETITNGEQFFTKPEDHLRIYRLPLTKAGVSAKYIM